MSQLWAIGSNPRKKRRSAAQKAATRKMVAANRRRRNPRAAATPRKRARRRTTARAVVRRTRSAVRRTGTRARRYARRASGSLRGIGGGAMGLVKAGAIGAGGALAVDVAMGFVNGFLPASMATKLNADGSNNYMNYAVKGALAVALAHFGGKVVSRETAQRMAAGSMTVMAYELLRPLAQSVLPASMSLGYYANANTPSGTLGRLGQYQNLSGLSGGMAISKKVSQIRSPNAAPASRHTHG